MIRVNKMEKECILKEYPKAYFVRTDKQTSKKHHYYFEEMPDIVECIKRIRNGVNA